MHMNLFYRASAWQQFLSKSNLVISIFSSPNWLFTEQQSGLVPNQYICVGAQDWELELNTLPSKSMWNALVSASGVWLQKLVERFQLDLTRHVYMMNTASFPTYSLISRSTICSAVCTASEQQPPLAHIKPNVLKAMSRSPCCWILPLRNHLCKRIIMSTVK